MFEDFFAGFRSGFIRTFWRNEQWRRHLATSGRGPVVSHDGIVKDLNIPMEDFNNFVVLFLFVRFPENSVLSDVAVFKADSRCKAVTV